MQAPDDEALSALIRREATRHVAPPDLAPRIVADVRAAAVRPAAEHRSTAVRHAWRRWLESTLVFGAGAATAWVVAGSLFVPITADRTADDIAAAHVRSLMATHLTDVASTDRHTVKPWFAGRLDFSPPVHDLVAEGFPLAGARLDYLAGRPVAALVYREGEHVINLFVWPAAANSASMATRARQGYNVVGWAQHGMQFWAVSDASADELHRFTDTLQAQIESTTTP